MMTTKNLIAEFPSPLAPQDMTNWYMYTGKGDQLLDGRIAFYDLFNNLGTGVDGLRLGIGAGASNTTGQHNICIGSNAGAAVTGGNDLILIGYNAGAAITADYSDGPVVIGSNAAQSVPSVTSGCVVIGGSNIRELTMSPNAVTLIGQYIAGAASTPSTFNQVVAIGEAALESFATGSLSDVIAIGNTPISFLTTGSLTDVIAIGDNPLSGITTGTLTDVIVIGNAALSGAITGTVSDTVAIGLNAGSTLTSGGYCTFLGAYANTNDGASSYRTAIGNGAIVTADHRVVLGTSSEMTFAPGGIATMAIAGVPVDGDFASPVDGLIAVDTASDAFYYRSSGTWHTPAGGGTTSFTAPTTRLSLTSATPVTTGDVTAATTLYATLFMGNTMTIYNGAAFQTVSFSELSIKLTDSSQTGGTITGTTITGLTDTSHLVRGMKLSASTGTGTLAGSTVIATIVSPTSITVNNVASVDGTLTNLVFKLVGSNTGYDVFAIISGGTAELQFSNAWASASARTDALGLQSGVYVNNAVINSGDSNSIPAKQGLYLGTIFTTATAGQTEDSYGGASQAGGRRFVWNYYNRVTRQLAVVDTTSSWTYTTQTWRQANGAAGNKVECIIGISEDPVIVKALGQINNTVDGTLAAVGVGIDSTSVNSAQQLIAGDGTAVSAPGFEANYGSYLAAGYHSIAWLEISQATGLTSWLGNLGGPFVQTGLLASVQG